jgi:23S rRNA pseudouridine2604 synthase
LALTRVYDGSEPVRINKWLGQSGVCSRREADTLIADGMVEMDGQVVTDAGRKIEPGQTLTLADRAEARWRLASPRDAQPVGYVSGQPEPGKVPAVRLLTAANRLGEGDVRRPMPPCRPSGVWMRIRADYCCCRQTASWPRR